MMRDFKIRKALLIPLLIDTLLLVALFACAVLFKEGVLQIALSGFFVVVLAFVSGEMACRRIIITNEALIIKKFFKNRLIPWEDITEIDALVLRKRVHFLLTTKRGFYFFSNAYEGAYECVKMIRELLDEERVTPTIKDILEYPIKNNGDVIAAILAGIAIILIMYFKYF